MSASGGIIFNEKGQLLIVKPIYREDWLIPGGKIEDNESPSQACIREIKEEIGLDLILDRLLCMGYHRLSNSGEEFYQFLFHIGSINQNQINDIILQESELCEYRFLDFKDTKGLLNSSLFDDISFALRAMEENRIIYLERRKEF